MSDLHEQAVAKLLADAEIRRTLARYCHTIDDGDFEGLAECFAADAELDAFGRTRNGREAVIALLTKAMPPESRGKHLVCNSVVDGAEEGDGGVLRAGVLSDFCFIGPDGSAKTGRYADEFVHSDGAWRIAKRAITFTGG
jgi:3-phenylpropionate/cinnamic acid dioxygenase small subunit